MKADGSSTEPVTLDAVGLPTGSAAWVPFWCAFCTVGYGCNTGFCCMWTMGSGFIHHLDAFGGPWRTHFLGEGAARVCS